MATLRFKLIKHFPTACFRILPGSYVKGKYVPGAEQSFQILANIQPLKYHEQMLLKESDRSKQWITVFTNDNLRGLEEGDTGYQGDVIIWQGCRYRVMKVKQYQVGTSIDHFQAQAAREELTPTAV